MLFCFTKIRIGCTRLTNKVFNPRLFIPAFFFFAILFSSCSDDAPVQPPPEIIDTVNRYDWRVDTVQGYHLESIYSADSVNVYFCSGYGAVYYNGTTYQSVDLQDPGFYSERISGRDKDNIFIGGGYPGTLLGEPIIKKITNGTVSTFVIQSDSGGYPQDILVVGPNECWISTVNRWTIYHFIDGVFTPYIFESGELQGTFFTDVLNNLFVFTYKYFGGGTIALSYYRFINNTFVKIGSDTITQNTEMQQTISRCGNDLLRTGLTSVFNFNGQTWGKICNTINFYPLNISGQSKTDFLCWCACVLQYRIFTWNGKSWKQESIPLQLRNSTLQIYGQSFSNNSIYYSLFDYFDIHSYVLKGKKHL